MNLFGSGDTDEIMSAIEVVYAYINSDIDGVAGAGFERAANDIFSSERVAFEIVEGRAVEFDSKELHAEVVVPTLRLLSGRKGWDPVEVSYQNALREIGVDPSDAITDAGTALQEAFELLGCNGNSLGPLAKSARQKGILAAHDGTLSDAVVRIVDWVSADRSIRGDAHNARPATRDDAWFTVHVVGALLLRLASDP